MKLIHLPSETVSNYDEKSAKTLLNSAQADYIRSTIPEHWRVEGYDKGWEWANANSETQDKKEWDWVSNKSLRSKKIANAFFEGNILQKQTQLIFRAEFEYHIYNPWKAKQGKAREYDSPIINELLAEVEKEKENEMNWLRSSQEMNWLRSSQAGWLVDPANGLLKNPTKEHLQLLAESMGYDLVKKKESEKRWESEDNHFCFYNEELSCWIVDKIDGHAIVLDRKEITQLIKEVGHIIEKYEEFI